MAEQTLGMVITGLAEWAGQLDQSDLEKPWGWNSYDEEGVRFGFFRIMEELRTLAVELIQDRMAAGDPPNQSQRIMAQYHAAYCDLKGALIGLNDADLNRPPAENEWSVRKTLAHILGADMGFYVLIRYALDRHRLSDGRAEHPGDADYEKYLDLNETGYTELMNLPVQGLCDYYEDLHARIVAEFSQIDDGELELDSYYWEKEPYPLRFRLHRFESHLRQHTVQIDKTLAAIDRLPAEPARLARLVLAALAEAEGAQFGANEIGMDRVRQTASRVAGWLSEMRGAI